MQASARYLGTLDSAGQKVIGRSLSAKSSARLSLSDEALDVVRIAGSFRIPTIPATPSCGWWRAGRPNIGAITLKPHWLTTAVW